MWVIHWKSKHTGFEGQGKPITYELATAWKRDLEARWHKDLDHWLERA